MYQEGNKNELIKNKSAKGKTNPSNHKALEEIQKLTESLWTTYTVQFSV